MMKTGFAVERRIDIRFVMCAIQDPQSEYVATNILSTGSNPLPSSKHLSVGVKARHQLELLIPS